MISNESYRRYLIDDGFSENKWPESRSIGSFKGTQLLENTVKASIVKAIAKTWGVTVEEVLEASPATEEKKQVVGKRGDAEVTASIEVIKRPGA